LSRPVLEAGAWPASKRFDAIFSHSHPFRNQLAVC